MHYKQNYGQQGGY